MSSEGFTDRAPHSLYLEFRVPVFVVLSITMAILWVDKIHFAPPTKPSNDDWPLNTNHGFPWVQSGGEMDFATIHSIKTIKRDPLNGAKGRPREPCLRSDVRPPRWSSRSCCWGSSEISSASQGSQALGGRRFEVLRERGFCEPSTEYFWQRINAPLKNGVVEGAFACLFWFSLA